MISLEEALQYLGELAPLDLAEEWDNVGLLVEPTRRRRIDTLFLTIDLTEPVVAEARKKGAGLIVAYHPPIFRPLTRLGQGHPRERVILQCIEAGIPIYSPHTAVDAAPGGVNDWLADGLGDGLRRGLKRPRCAIELSSDDAAPVVGQGREVVLKTPASLPAMVERIKRHLSLEHVRVAAPSGPARRIAKVALCAGAGGEVLDGSDADLLLTGEMRHHDVLAATGRGQSVVLCDHTNTERGYLKVLKRLLAARFPSRVRVDISRTDADPLRIR